MRAPSRDVLWIIAEFLEPNPIVYCKLALVNRNFYHVFTSDKIWKELDVYNVKRDIISSFYAACCNSPEDYGLLSLVWWRAVDWGPHTLREFTDNQFVWLGYLLKCCTKESWLGFEKYNDLIRTVFRIDPQQFMWTPSSIRDVYEYSLYAVQMAEDNYGYIPEELEDDPGLLKAALDRGFYGALKYHEQLIPQYKEPLREYFMAEPTRIEWLSAPLFEDMFLYDRDLVLRVLPKVPWRLVETTVYADDYEIMFIAVTSKNHTPLLKYVSSRLQDNIDLVTAAVECTGANILSASPRLARHHKIKLAAIKNWIGPFATPGFGVLMLLLGIQELSHPEIMEAIVTKSGALLRELPLGADNYGIVLKAVKNDGRAIYFASESLRQDKTLTLEAVRQSFLAYKYINPDFKDDRDIIEAALSRNGYALSVIPKELHDYHIVDVAVSHNGMALEYAAEEFRDNLDIVKKAVKLSFPSLTFISERLKNDREVVFAAFENRGDDHDKIPLHLLHDLDFMEPIVAKNGTKLPILLHNRNFALLSLAKDGKNYRYIPQKFRNDLSFNIEAVKRNGLVFNELDEKFFYCKEIQKEIT